MGKTAVVKLLEAVIYSHLVNFKLLTLMVFRIITIFMHRNPTVVVFIAFFTTGMFRMFTLAIFRIATAVMC